MKTGSNFVWIDQYLWTQIPHEYCPTTMVYRVAEARELEAVDLRWPEHSQNHTLHHKYTRKLYF